MWNVPDIKTLQALPELHANEHLSFGEEIVHLHFFIYNSDWYITEFDGVDTFYGFCILNGDSEMAEWGYVSFKELKSICVAQGIEVDNNKFWLPTQAKNIKKIMDTPIMKAMEGC